MVTVGGPVDLTDTVDVVLDPSQMRLSHVMVATAAPGVDLLQGVDLLHLVAVCKGLHVTV